uniref:Uncharacterized protein n=1 Tax=Cacopsylla melanoneura TaxID=428564 RepID=A0A8D9B4A1_9HEMI
MMRGEKLSGTRMARKSKETNELLLQRMEERENSSSKILKLQTLACTLVQVMLTKLRLKLLFSIRTGLTRSSRTQLPLKERNWLLILSCKIRLPPLTGSSMENLSKLMTELKSRTWAAVNISSSSTSWNCRTPVRSWSSPVEI